MIILSGASDVLRLVTTSAASLSVVAAFATYVSASDITPGNKPTAIAAATTTVVVPAPPSGAHRTVRFLAIRNTHATTANTITIELFNGTTAYAFYQVALAAGEQLLYDEANGWQYLNALGMPKTAQSQGSAAPAVSTINVTVLSADVVNNNATANSIADVTGLSFPVVAGNTYWFEFFIDYTAAATTTGSRWTVNGPAFARLAYTQAWSLTVTTNTLGNQVAYGQPAGSNTTSAAIAGNVAWLSGFITPSADGNVIARFASEIASSAITAKAGSVCRYMRVL